MVETVGSLVALPDATAQLVERAAGSIVSVRGGGRWQTSGIHWRSGILAQQSQACCRLQTRRVSPCDGYILSLASSTVLSARIDLEDLASKLTRRF